MNILFVGDIVGKPGRRALQNHLNKVREEHDISLTVVNGENAAGGFGITASIMDILFEMKVDVITTGNHVWDKKEALTLITKEDRLLRPLNYPPGTPGAGSVVVRSSEGLKVAVLNVEGRVFMRPVDCPFRAAENEIELLSNETSIILVDIHAEATSEKIAMGRFLDGRVSAVVGTHTHVQTADDQIFPGGTAYITDVGMTGPSESVIGVKHEIIVNRFLTGLPERFETAKNYPQLQAVVISVNPADGKAESITRLNISDKMAP